MKKIISLFAALTVISSFCVANVQAKDGKIDVVATQVEMTQDEIAELNSIIEDELGEDPIVIDSDYKAYKVTFALNDVPLFDSTTKNRVMTFEGNLTFKDGGYAATQFPVIFSDSTFAASALLEDADKCYKATFLASAYKDMYSATSSTIDNAVTIAVVVKPGTTATVGANYTEWYNSTKKKVEQPLNIETTTLTFGGSSTVDVTGIKLDKESLKFDLNGTKTETLTATVEPENATDKTVTWSIAEEDKEYVEINTKDNTCSITALKVTPEDKTVTVTATAGKASASCKITVVDTTPKPDSESSQKEITKVDGKTLFKIGTIFNNAPATKRISVYSTSLKDTRESTKTIAELLNGEAKEGTIDVEITVGILTDRTNDVFTFGLVD